VSASARHNDRTALTHAALLEHLSLFEEKTIPAIFRESEFSRSVTPASADDGLDVMPLIYNSLECEHMPVQERVLKAVPHLCEILDYGTVQNILLVKVAVSCLLT
jgi:SCY1-like protein 2